MKKVFVSIPLKGRSKEDIQTSLDKIKEAVEGLLDEKVELLHQDIKDIPDFDKDEAKESLKFLSKDLDLMSEADYFATVECNWDFRHCTLEEDIFKKYFASDYEESKEKIMSFSINIVCPDVARKERERAKKLWGDNALKDEERPVFEEAIEEKIRQD